MAKRCLIPVVGAGWIVLGLIGALQAGDPRDNAIALTLRVQNAMLQGKDFLLRNDAKAAVYVLESELDWINGNAAYLSLLREAYSKYVQELSLSSKTAELQLYKKRLKILDPGSDMEQGFLQARATGEPAKATAPVPAPTPAKVSEPVEAKPTPNSAKPETIRATMEDPPRDLIAGGSLLARAEEAFGGKKYKEAGQLFDQVQKSDPVSMANSRERWAYCKLHQVVEAINQSGPGGPAWAELEKEILLAIDLAPRLQYAQYLLGEVRKRRGTASAAEPEAPPVAVKHIERDASGWARAETVYFRIHHNQTPAMAAQVAQAAERTRAAVHKKWLGGTMEEWDTLCDVYLHATGQDYTKATSIPLHSPGHSTIRSEKGRVASRRIDLRVDEAGMLTAVLPRETTHVVLAGQFGDKQVPRWADEGIAVLSEPRERVDGYLRNLPQLKQQSQLFPADQLLQLSDYPDSKRITAFYAQSISLVEFLTAQGGPQVFTQFLRESATAGYEPSLKKHYNYASFDALHQAWVQKTFTAPMGGVAQTK